MSENTEIFFRNRSRNILFSDLLDGEWFVTRCNHPRHLYRKVHSNHYLDVNQNRVISLEHSDQTEFQRRGVQRVEVSIQAEILP